MSHTMDWISAEEEQTRTRAKAVNAMMISLWGGSIDIPASDDIKVTIREEDGTRLMEHNRQIKHPEEVKKPGFGTRFLAFFHVKSAMEKVTEYKNYLSEKSDYDSYVENGNLLKNKREEERNLKEKMDRAEAEREAQTERKLEAEKASERSNSISRRNTITRQKETGKTGPKA